MEVLHDFALIASDTARTKAYMQKMVKEGMIPAMCIIYTDDIKKIYEEKEFFYKKEFYGGKYYDSSIPILCMAERYDINYIIVEDKDINSEKMLSCIKKLPQKYLIYSGYGGYILKAHLFQLDKKIIHVHAGKLPQYRGSTTAYYSILKEGKIFATAIFMNEKIDEGEIIAAKSFDVPKENVDIDYIYEPYARSCVLVDAIRSIKNNEVQPKKQNSEDAEIYYIIHPVLKHMAMLKIEQMRGDVKDEDSNLYTKG